MDIGSSPLTRGKLDDVQGPVNDARLIPAHAGKTFNLDALLRANPAHPRSRGENPVRQDTRHLAPGSSPLTRGKRE